MSESFDEALSGVAASIAARLKLYEDSGITHIPHPRTTPHLAVTSSENVSGAQGGEQSTVAQKDRLQVLQDEKLGECTRCDLHQTRKNIVFGVGNPNAALVFVGEVPGAEEDRKGEPFVGRAGELLTKMISAMGYSRDDIYICNVVKCRPPNNRDPQPKEVDTCAPFLKEQLDILSPQVIVTLGRYASQTLLRTEESMGQLRGNWAKYEGIDVMPTFHPAFLLRTPSRKRDVWLDLQKVMTHLGK